MSAALIHNTEKMTMITENIYRKSMDFSNWRKRNKVKL